MTPREFTIEMKAQVERLYDEYERQADFTMMRRSGYHAKKLRTAELFKRPKDEDQRKAEDTRERTARKMKKVARFAEFADLLDGEEETNG